MTTLAERLSTAMNTGATSVRVTQAEYDTIAAQVEAQDQYHSGLVPDYVPRGMVGFFGGIDLIVDEDAAND